MTKGNWRLKDFSISAATNRRLRTPGPWIALTLVVCCANRIHSQIPNMPAPQAEVGESTLQGIQKLIDAGEFNHAASQLGSFLKNDQNSARAHTMLAYCMLRMDDPKGSLAEYTRSAALARPDSTDLQNVAKDYALLNDIPDADHWMMLAVKMDPKNAEAWYGLGRIRYTQQRFQDAADCFERALVFDPRSAKAENNLGLSYEGLNRTDDAISAYRNAIQWQKDSPHPSEQPLLNLGIVLLHQGKLPEAEQLLTQAASIAPRDSNIREQLGHLYLQTNELPKAQSQFEQAIALSPKNPALHFLLGRVYRAEGEDEKAKAEFARSEALSGYRSTPESN
ncbi:tetratricopeptide repeat protein [Granulicella sp. L46]|uniref:tetratricopeptide repeat protein n=1 Tax=Granulicella sp. L46 TaxID=1641865 RepID=UPI00131B59E4|nr:tetratricopeptide repeat protein [Granulicella sp. L46]